MSIGDVKPPLSELQHFGVLGMKWGHRQKASAADIRSARGRLSRQSKGYRQEVKKLSKTAEGSTKRASLERDLNKKRQAYLNNPDRVIAARMTKGEKYASLWLGGLEGGVGAIGSLASIAGTSAKSRRIEFKQENGGYKVDANAKIRKRASHDTAARLLIEAGGAAAPGLLKLVGSRAAASIGAKAAANRAAAKTIKPMGLGSAAAKLKYIKPSLRGVHKITTMK